MLLLLMLLCPCCCCRLQVKEQMADPAFQDSIRDASLAACTQLPAGVMQDTCTAFVEQYGEKLGVSEYTCFHAVLMVSCMPRPCCVSHSGLLLLCCHTPPLNHHRDDILQVPGRP